MNRDHLTRRQTISLATATAAASLFPARAEAAWPNKAIRFVVPFAPGGSSEIVARATAAELAKLLGQSVFVDNKPGGAGNVAMGEVARADDQHTLILGHIGTLAVGITQQPRSVDGVEGDRVSLSVAADGAFAILGERKIFPGDAHAREKELVSC